MEIATSFRLAVPPERAWPVLTDLERVAPCMPGVQVESADADGLQAKMRVKVGPVTAAYRTHIAMESRDDDARTAVLRATGRETRGPGTVEALVTAALKDEGEATAVDLKTDLTVTGKVAQFGGSVMTEVADRLLQQFAARLEEELSTEPAADGVDAVPRTDGANARTSRAQPAPPTAEPEPIDLGRIAGEALMPRIAIGVSVAAMLMALAALLRARPARS
jgi:carbon monoxide dehydrogenase subunit G